MIGIIQKDISLNQLTLNLNMLTVQLLKLKDNENIRLSFSGRAKKNISSNVHVILSIGKYLG